MEEIERDADGHVTLAESSSDAKVRTIRSMVRFAYDGPNRLSWRQEKGELKSVDGSWELEDLGDGRTRELPPRGRTGPRARPGHPRPTGRCAAQPTRQCACGRTEEASRGSVRPRSGRSSSRTPSSWRRTHVVISSDEEAARPSSPTPHAYDPRLSWVTSPRGSPSARAPAARPCLRRCPARARPSPPTDRG